ncbi:hypothetical protein [Corallococcus exiguus]|uniref:Lipoprotein n=1 Tax=Corallococcus exiguus TaxID=83462 RepID=A0A7X5BSV3_9BACT|nr:hypothetical protein [Corallococcus exiguus]NBC42329.1 hypothetical protein [Corallococcus exiguus]TNV60548.1 hypothetical protein FH620_24030 [Corallococcus exiguus]
MRRLIAAVSLSTLAGCAYVGIGQTPTGSRFSPQSSGSGPVVIRVGTAEPAPLETPKTEESTPSKKSSTAEVSDAPGATQ